RFGAERAHCDVMCRFYGGEPVAIGADEARSRKRHTIELEIRGSCSVQSPIRSDLEPARVGRDSKHAHARRVRRLAARTRRDEKLVGGRSVSDHVLLSLQYI